MDLSDPPPNPQPTLGSPYGYSAPQMKPYLSAADCPNPLGANPLTFPNIPIPIQPPHRFPTMQAAPANLRPRHPGHQEQLSTLDVDYNLSDHDVVRDIKILDANRLMGGAHGKIEIDEAYDKLQEHCRERMGFVQAASERLQAATGMRNDHKFELPNPRSPTLPRTFGPQSPPQYPIAQDTIGASNAHATNNFGPKLNLAAELGGTRLDSGVALHYKLAMNVPSATDVDPETGKGLREWLMMTGKQFGLRKRECTSVSLHDFTPNPKTGAFANVLLGHYGKGGSGERIDVYETDVPMSMIDEGTGNTRVVLESWVWFLISRPVLSIKANDHSTRPQYPESSSSYSDGDSSPASTQFYTPMSGSSKENEDASMHTTQNTPPPNFPSPIPSSFVVFACPLTYLTEYDELTENSPPPATPPSRSQSTLPWISQSTNKKMYKRKDYDLAHQGIPLFEFHGAAGVFGPNCTEKFLSVEALGPWYNNDPYQLRPAEESQRMHMEWASAIGPDAMEANEHLEEIGQRRSIRNMLDEPPAPYMGTWWAAFYKGVWEDCERWRAVMRAMGTGKLRVVVRWVEVERAEWIDPLRQGQDAEMQDLGLDVGPSFEGVKESAFGARKNHKSKFSGAGAGGSRHARGRSEFSHKRSGLSTTSDVLMGVGRPNFMAGGGTWAEKEKPGNK